MLRERAGADPAESYTARLLAAGIDRVARKVGEEATEVVIAALRAVAVAGAERSAVATGRWRGADSPSSATVAPQPVAAGAPPTSWPASAGGPDADPSAPGAALPSVVAAPPSAGPASEAALRHAPGAAGGLAAGALASSSPDAAAPSRVADPAPPPGSPLRHRIEQPGDRAAGSPAAGVSGRGPGAALVRDAPSSSPLAAEAADLLYHLLVLLLSAGVEPGEVAAELRRRHARPATPPSAKPEDAPPSAARSGSEGAPPPAPGSPEHPA